MITDGHIKQILEMFASKADIDLVSKLVLNEDISNNENNYSLSVSTYVDAKDTREVVNIGNLNADLNTTVSKITQLRSDIDAIVAEIETGKAKA